MIRKCIYTGLDANMKDHLLSSDDRGISEKHNWANKAPVNQEYWEMKKNRLATIDEILTHQAFYELELARLKVAHLEARLKELQKKNRETMPEKIEKISKKHKKQIDQAIHEKEVLEEAEQLVDNELERVKNTTIWD